MLSRKRTNSFTSTSNESSPRSTHRDYYDGEYNKMWEDVKKMKLGSTVAYVPNNQMGYKRYRVVKKKGKKTLKLIEDYEGSHQSRSESSIESVNSHESESSMQSRGSKRRKVGGGKKQKSRRKRNN